MARHRLYPGRPPIGPEITELIVRTARENSGRGHDRMAGALDKSGPSCLRSNHKSAWPLTISIDTILDIRYSFLDETNRNGPSAAYLRSRSGPKIPTTAGRQPVHKRGSRISSEQRQATDLPRKQGLSGVKSKPEGLPVRGCSRLSMRKCTRLI
jgi:hypothetical protein